MKVKYRVGEDYSSKKGETMPFEIVRNDITKMHVDAIVNPTNAEMYGVAGVDGMIHKIEGPRLRDETAKMGPLAPGKCALTEAFNLPAGFIIHTVGPVWKDGNSGEEEVLKSCYKNALALAKERGFESVAFPLISSGSYGYPKDIALSVAISSIGEFLLFNEMTVYLVVFDKKAYQLSEALYASVESYIDDHYIEEHKFSNRYRESERREIAYSVPYSPKQQSMDDVIKRMDETFAEMLLRLIDERGLKDPDVYKKANVTKQTFSKIRNNNQYTPTKQTAVAFAIALQLNLDETKDLLLKSGFALSNSNYFDVIISYFLESKRYDVNEINSVLFHYNEKLLGY